MPTLTPNIKELVAPQIHIESFKWKNPSDWIIVSTGDNTIKATCIKYNEAFEGTIEEFNSRLKG